MLARILGPQSMCSTNKNTRNKTNSSQILFNPLQRIQMCQRISLDLIQFRTKFELESIHSMDTLLLKRNKTFHASSNPVQHFWMTFWMMGNYLVNPLRTTIFPSPHQYMHVTIFCRSCTRFLVPRTFMFPGPL
jgi:hypothetical protein